MNYQIKWLKYNARAWCLLFPFLWIAGLSMHWSRELAQFVVHIYFLLSAISLVSSVKKKELETGQFTKADLLTLLRLVLTELVFILSGFFTISNIFLSVILLIIVVLDALDGWAARTWGGTISGASLDMESDSIIIAAIYFLLMIKGLVPPWIIFLGLMRFIYAQIWFLFPSVFMPYQDVQAPRWFSLYAKTIAALVASAMVLPPLLEGIAVSLLKNVEPLYLILTALLFLSFAIESYLRIRIKNDTVY